MGRKPIATRNAAVVAAARAGHSRAEIAARFGLTLVNVSAICRKAREAGVPVARFRDNGDAAPALWRMAVPEEVEIALSAPARRRGLKVAELAGRLLAACAEEPVLIDNILEDM